MELEKVIGARIFMEMKDGSMSYNITMKKDDKTGKIILTLFMDDTKKGDVELEEKYFTALKKVIEKNDLLNWTPGKVGINQTPFDEGFEIFFEGNRSREFEWEQPYENLVEPCNLIDFLFSLKTLVPGVMDHHGHGGGCCGGHSHDHDHSHEKKEEKEEECCGGKCDHEKKKEDSCCGGKCEHEKKKEESCCGGKCDHK